MKFNPPKYAESEAAGERYFRIIYRATLVLALIGAAMFCVVQFTGLGRSHIVLGAGSQNSAAEDATPDPDLLASLEQLRQQKEALLQHVADTENRLLVNSNAYHTLKSQYRQTSEELKQAEEKFVALSAELESRQTESEKESAPADDEIASLNQTKRELTTIIEKLGAEKRTSEESIRRAKQDKDRSLQEVAKVRKEIEAARKDAAKARQDTDKARRDTNKARQETAQVRREKAQAENELKRAKQQKDSATRELNRKNADLKKVDTKRRQSEVAANKIRQQQQKAATDLACTQKKQKELDDEIWKLTAQKLSLEHVLKDSAKGGLKVTYFKSRDLKGPGVQRIDPEVDFDWKDRGPIAELGGDNFSARWEGQLEAPASGTYTIYTVSNDGVRLWVNGKKIIDQWNQHGPTEHKGKVEMKAGQRYDVKMEYYEAGGTAVAKLAWSGPGLTRSIVPHTRLFPPGK